MLTAKPTLRLFNPQIGGGMGITLTMDASTAAIQTAVPVVNGSLHGAKSNKVIIVVISNK